MFVRPARSRVPHVKGNPSGNSACGSEVKRCGGCLRADRLTKETIHNGLTLLRVRYGLPYCELPDVSPSDLGRFHQFLLGQGKERASVPFPRRQRRRNDGLCSLQRLRRHERWELALSVASIKRNLPSGCPQHTPSKQSEWVKTACSPNPPHSSPEYLDHVRKVAARVFTNGWDRGYENFVNSHLPNPSARLPKLSRADMLWAGRREEFRTLCLDETDLAPVFQARYKEVVSTGKRRPLLIYDENVELLGPLHKLMYSHLRRQEWLLCGPPTAERMTSVCTGDYQTSVDLVAATDGLCHDVAETLLDVAFFPSVKVPRSLRAFAKASLKPEIVNVPGSPVVSHGQMMGSYLSFPLLCLQSYCAATWAARNCENPQFLVNGDDTVISAERGVLATDYPDGFQLNKDKTIVAKNVVEVNSTVFLRRGGAWREVRHARRLGAPTDYAGMLHMASACSVTPQMESAFSRARIGRRWGFLPSQLGHKTYPSYLRERGLSLRRHWTPLPEPTALQDMEGLRRVSGDPTAADAEALRAFLWESGRKGGMKRDVYNPSVGSIRRTYGYVAPRRVLQRQRPLRGERWWWLTSFVVWSGRCHPPTAVKGAGWFLVPDDYSTEEEAVGLFMLELRRQAWVSQAEE